MKTRIIVDSTADVPPEVKSRLSVVPLTIRFGSEEYIDGVTLTHREFYEKLAASDVLPTTSQATPAVFADLFEEVVSAGDSAVVITISSKFSGTYQSAVIAAEEYPDRIFVVDSENATISFGVLAEFALQLADSGMSAREIAEQICDQRKNVCLIAMLDTLEYLKKGGRISGAVAFVGGMLSIKPMITLKDGEIVLLGKARGSKQGNQMMISEIQKAGGIDFSKPILLGYTGLTTELLQKYVDDSAALWQNGTEALRRTEICGVIGTHVGPGAIAAAFFKNAT